MVLNLPNSVFAKFMSKEKYIRFFLYLDELLRMKTFIAGSAIKLLLNYFQENLYTYKIYRPFILFVYVCMYIYANLPSKKLISFLSFKEIFLIICGI